MRHTPPYNDHCHAKSHAVNSGNLSVFEIHTSGVLHTGLCVLKRKVVNCVQEKLNSIAQTDSLGFIQQFVLNR